MPALNKLLATTTSHLLGQQQVLTLVVISHSESASVSTNDPANLIEVEDGEFIGLSFGYAFHAPVLLFNRVEVYGSGSDADNEHKRIGAFGLRSVDNNAVIAFASIPVEDTVGKVWT